MKKQTKCTLPKEGSEFPLIFPFVEEDCTRTMYEACPKGAKDNAGCIAILKLDALNPNYRAPEYQLFRLECGFGVNPVLSGNACFGTFCADGERCRMQKYDFYGIANEHVTKIAEELERRRKALLPPQKEKALELMEQLGITESEKTEFRLMDSLTCFFPTFLLMMTLDVDLRKKIDEIEKKFNVLVYAAIYGEFSFGRTVNFLIVPDYEEDWDTLFRQGENENNVYAYVWNLTEEAFSEFGYITVKNSNGNLRRVL